MQSLRWTCCLAACWFALAGQGRGAELTGVVLDDRGEPVPGARVDISTAAPKVGQGIFCPSCYLDCRKLATTDAGGKFTIAELSDELRFNVLVTAPGKQAQLTGLIDPKESELKIALLPKPQVPDERRVAGVIVDEDGLPISGALVATVGAKTAERRWWGRVDGVSPVVSDSDGRFEVAAAEGFLGIDLEVEADGYCGTSTELIDVGSNEVRIEVPTGASVHGSLSSAGKPVAGARVAVVQMNRGVDNHFIAAVAATTNDDGEFVIDYLPPSQEYAIFSPVGPDPQDGLVFATKRFTMPASRAARDVGDLRLGPGVSVSGRVEPPEGSELPKSIKLSFGREPAWDLIEVIPDRTGAFQAHGLPPETYEIRFSAPGWQLDPTRLGYQKLRGESFGVHLDESRQDLIIPIRPTQPAPAEPAAGGVAPSKPSQQPGDSDVTPESLPAAAVAIDTGLPVERTAEPTSARCPQLQVQGVVSDTEGAPIEGATVVLRAKLGGTFYSMGVKHNRDVLATTTTNGAGQFSLRDVSIPLRMTDIIAKLKAGDGGAEVLVIADGYGLAWQDVAGLNTGSPIDLRLSREAEASGTVTDIEGAPVPGAHVAVLGITPAEETFDGFLRSPGDLNLMLSQRQTEGITDGLGRFRLPNMPTGCRILLSIEAKGFDRASFFLNTGDDSRRGVLTAHSVGYTTPVQSSPASVELKPTKYLEVTVVDAAGQPVTDGAINLVDNKRRPVGWETVSLEGVACLVVKQNEPATFSVHYTPDPMLPRLGASVQVEVDPSGGPSVARVVLPPSRELRGRVIDDDTGQGIPGALVAYSKAAETASGQARTGSTCLSDAEGNFRIPVATGPGGLKVSGELYGFYLQDSKTRERFASADINVPVEGEVRSVTLQVGRGLVVRGRVVMENGSPVAGALVHWQSERAAGVAETDGEGTYEIDGLPPHEDAVISVATATGGCLEVLSATADLPPGKTQWAERELKLKPGIILAGRVLRDGEPEQGVRVEVTRSHPDFESRIFKYASTKTDSDGRYAVAGFEPGDRYSFRIEAEDGSSDPEWKHQSPYSQRVPESARGQINLTKVNLMSQGQTLRGIVVDGDGNGVSGVKVSARLPNGRPLAARNDRGRPWVETDERGAFVLAHLPDVPLTLLAYRRISAGGTIHFPADMKVDRNQSDIRIRIDPNLTAEVESLDAP